MFTFQYQIRQSLTLTSWPSAETVLCLKRLRLFNVDKKAMMLLSCLVLYN